MLETPEQDAPAEESAVNDDQHNPAAPTPAGAPVEADTDKDADEDADEDEA